MKTIADLVGAHQVHLQVQRHRRKRKRKQPNCALLFIVWIMFMPKATILLKVLNWTDARSFRCNFAQLNVPPAVLNIAFPSSFSIIDCSISSIRGRCEAGADKCNNPCIPVLLCYPLEEFASSSDSSPNSREMTASAPPPPSLQAKAAAIVISDSDTIRFSFLPIPRTCTVIQISCLRGVKSCVNCSSASKCPSAFHVNRSSFFVCAFTRSCCACWCLFIYASLYTFLCTFLCTYTLMYKHK